MIQNDIRMTSMPAFNPTHTDDQIWDLVAFLRRMPELSPKQYAQRVAEAAAGSEHAAEPHDHHDGGGEHHPEPPG